MEEFQTEYYQNGLETHHTKRKGWKIADRRAEKYKLFGWRERKKHDKCGLSTLDMNNKQLWRLIVYNVNVEHISHAVFAMFMW